MTEQPEELTTDLETVEDDDKQEVAYGWMYLLFLFAVFVVLALLAYSCDDDSTGSALTETVVAIDDTSSATASDDTETAADLTPIALDASVLGGTVTLSGAVPDEAARTQMIEIAEKRYGAGNVVDELTIDADTTIKGGTITVHGETTEGDELPGLLASDFASAVGLTGNADGVTYTEIAQTPFAATATVDIDKVVLAGEMPDQAAIDALVASAGETWGADNVDSSGLTLGENLTAEGGTLTVAGSIDAGDTRPGDFAAAVEAAIAGIATDASGVEVDTSPAALARAEEALTAALAAEPILFASGSAEIDPASDEILARVAAAITAAPGIDVEIVGHTDSQGSASINTALSASRASAVLDRLVELGVEADRLTSRGAGEDEPIDSNDTEEGRAANRRIAFEFAGAAG